MREIIFRGKTVDRDRWVYGSLISLDDDCCFIVPMIVRASTLSKRDLVRMEMEAVSPGSIGQYTGVKDKNGVRVFEGDIVRTQFGRLVRIEYRTLEGFVGFDMTAIESEHERPWSSTAWRSGNIEVVGNIHDNHEMLKQ